MKRILHIVGGMYPGGLENFIMNIYRHIDRDKVQFDVIVHSIREGDHTPEIESLGGKVYLAPRKSRHPVANFLYIRKVVKQGKYSVVVRHSDNAFPVTDMIAAKMGGAKRRIYQSHSSDSSLKALHYFFRHCMGWAVTDRFACSENAGRWMYKNRDFKVVKNAIEVEKYTFNEEVRNRVRKEWGLTDKLVFSHVGLYIPVKNHLFLVRFFAEIEKKREDAVLLLIGEGDLRETIEAEAKRLGIEDKVILTGIRKDVPELLQMTDAFLFPSIYEGLPLSIIEAQAAGLPCLISSAITKEVIVTDLVKQLSLEDDPEIWAETAIEMASGTVRKDRTEEIGKAGYDVSELAKWYESL